MTSAWSYFNPVRVVSASGACLRLESLVDFQRIVLVTSPGFQRRGLVGKLGAALGERLAAVVHDVSPNPDVLDIDRQASIVRGAVPHADAVVGLGGGSSIDTAKALARLLAQPSGFTLAAHLRAGEPLVSDRALPLIAIPTTAGTGAEVTPFGTVWDFELAKKYSITGADLFPAVAILDPELTLDLPLDVTISSGLDAISHALESTWNRNATPVTLGLAAKSLQLTIPALRELHRDPNGAQARCAMMEGSLLAGLAISQTRTALAHSISYPLTARLDVPHGIACSFTLPAILRFNAEEDDGRLADLSRALGCKEIEGLAAVLDDLFELLEVADVFQQYVKKPESIIQYVDEMLAPGRADNNLRSASVDDVRALLVATLASFPGGYRSASSVDGN